MTDIELQQKEQLLVPTVCFLTQKMFVVISTAHKSNSVCKWKVLAKKRRFCVLPTSQYHQCGSGSGSNEKKLAPKNGL